MINKKKEQIKKCIGYLVLTIIFILFAHLFIGGVFSIERDLSFCEDIEKDDYQSPSCKGCFNVTYDYSKICENWREKQK